jgi:hypothetical protein
MMIVVVVVAAAAGGGGGGAAAAAVARSTTHGFGIGKKNNVTCVVNGEWSACAKFVRPTRGGTCTVPTWDHCDGVSSTKGQHATSVLRGR